MSILELDKLFLGTCVDLHLNIRNATSSRQFLHLPTAYRLTRDKHNIVTNPTPSSTFPLASLRTTKFIGAEL